MVGEIIEPAERKQKLILADLKDIGVPEAERVGLRVRTQLA
jgi:hypothetical protein